MTPEVRKGTNAIPRLHWKVAQTGQHEPNGRSSFRQARRTRLKLLSAIPVTPFAPCQRVCLTPFEPAGALLALIVMNPTGHDLMNGNADHAELETNPCHPSVCQPKTMPMCDPTLELGRHNRCGCKSNYKSPLALTRRILRDELGCRWTKIGLKWKWLNIVQCCELADESTLLPYT